jgi:xanthine/uracil permease
MDISEIQKALDFLNWQMLVAVGIITMATVQFLKEYLPDVWRKIPVLKLFTLAVGIVVAHFIFDIANVKHTETVALFHGFVGSLLASLGYELLKGTKLGLRSSDEVKR